MPDLESKEFAAQRNNQDGKSIKILTSNQMLSRFLIILAKLQASNNSNKLKKRLGIYHTLYNVQNNYRNHPIII